MGSGVSKLVFHVVRKPFRNFNIESRAHKVISQEKPVPAPKHKSDQLDYERLLKEHPGIVEESLKKHELLDRNLKQVYVKSHDELHPPIQEHPDRPLPLDRKIVEDFEYGIKEPEKIPLGRATLRQVLKFISDHQHDSNIHTAQRISNDYSIPQPIVENILKYCKVYEIYVPMQRKVKAKFAGPSVPKIRIATHPRKQLGSGESSDN